MEENFKALKELIDDPKYDAALPTLKDAANKLRGKVKDYRNFKMKSNTIPVTGSPAARELGGKEPESKEEKVSEKEEKVPERYQMLARTGRVFPEDELVKVARKAAEGEPGFQFELELAAEALDADKDSRVQLGAIGMSNVSYYLGGEPAHYEKQKLTGRVGADVVVWRPVPSSGKQPDLAVTQLRQL